MTSIRVAEIGQLVDAIAGDISGGVSRRRGVVLRARGGSRGGRRGRGCVG